MKPVCYCDKCGEPIYPKQDFYEIKVESENSWLNLCEYCMESCKTTAEDD